MPQWYKRALFDAARDVVRSQGHRPECKVVRVHMQVETPDGFPFYVIVEEEGAAPIPAVVQSPNGSAPLRDGTLRDKILVALRNAGKPMKGSLIALRIDHAYDANLLRLLSSMCKRGELVKLLEGYSLFSTPIPHNTEGLTRSDPFLSGIVGNNADVREI
jgi:hypothetical protein